MVRAVPQMQPGRPLSMGLENPLWGGLPTVGYCYPVCHATVPKLRRRRGVFAALPPAALCAAGRKPGDPAVRLDERSFVPPPGDDSAGAFSEGMAVVPQTPCDGARLLGVQHGDRAHAVVLDPGHGGNRRCFGKHPRGCNRSSEHSPRVRIFKSMREIPVATMVAAFRFRHLTTWKI